MSLTTSLPNQSYMRSIPILTQDKVSTSPIFLWFPRNEITHAAIAYLRKFLLLSHTIFLIWSIIAVILAATSFTTADQIFYINFWAAGLLLSGALPMLLTLCWPGDILRSLLRCFVCILIICIVGFIFFAFYYATSIVCIDIHDQSCISDLTSNVKLIFVVIFLISSLHTVVHITVVLHTRTTIATTRRSTTI